MGDQNHELNWVSDYLIKKKTDLLKRGGGGELRHFFLYFPINAEIMVINQLSMVKFRRNGQ